MSRVIKLFASPGEIEASQVEHKLLEKYDAFSLLEVSPSDVKKLAREFPIEDITDQYEIPLETKSVKAVKTLAARKKGTRSTRSVAADGKPHHYLVQFVGPIKQHWLAKVKTAGAEVREPYEGFTYVVRATNKVIESIENLPFVRWTGHLPHDQRIERNVSVVRGVIAETLPRTKVLPGVFVIEFFGANDATKAKANIKKLGFQILADEAKSEKLIVRHTGTPSAIKKAIQEVSAIHGVRMIRERTLDRPSNNVAVKIMGCSKSMTAGTSGLGLDGTGEVVAICDTGLDTGDPNSIHGDFAGRIVKISSFPISSELDDFLNNPGADDGGGDYDSGHGTHVAGSILGNGARSANLNGFLGSIRGPAYNAQLYFQAVEQMTNWKSAQDRVDYGRYGLWGIPSDLAKLFKPAYQAGARVHSNSWGGGKPGEYDDQCRALDQFVWDNKDFCVLVAAGNDGEDSDGDGKINPMSVTSPATAKNCITVGASENERPEFNAERYGDWWNTDYPVAPFKGDPMADRPNQVAAFSSRGPTKDGRVKPDLVAPGTFILSTRSTQIAANNKAWAAFPPSNAYFHMGGTSMATPLVAGAAALVRQFLRTKKSITKPSAALIKAVLIAATERLPGYAPVASLHDFQQGFGRVNLDSVLAPPTSTTVRFIEGAGLSTGQKKTFTFKVQSASKPLTILLAYTDYPGTKLVNNLNLLTTNPSGKKSTGNQSSGALLQFDALNNVEKIQIQAPKVGTWKLDVIGSNIPKGPQDFALVIRGGIAP